MIVSLLAAASLAFDPTATARQQLVANPSAGAAIACSRYEAVAPTLSALFKFFPASGAVSTVFDSAADPAARGIDVKAPVVIAFDKVPTRVQFGFSGTPEQADALVKALDPTATGGGVHWGLANGAAADLADGSLVFTQPSQKAAGGPRQFTPRTLPATDGCALVVDALAKDKPLQLAALVPYVGGGPSLAFLEAKKMPAAFRRTDAELVPARLPEAPTAVLTLSSPVQDILDALPKDAPAKDGMATLIANARAYASFPAGLTMVSQGNPKAGGAWAAVTRVTDLDGDAFPRGKVVKIMVDAMKDKDAKKVDKDTFSFQDKDKLTYVSVGKGGEVLMTSSVDLADTALGDEGVPWLTPEDEARARTATVALRASQPGKPGSVWFTLRGVDGGLEIASQLELPAEQRTAMLALGTMMAPMMQMMAAAKMKDVEAAIPAAP